MLACLAEVAPGIGAFPRGGRAVSRAIIPLDKQTLRAPPQPEAATFLSHKGYVLFQKSLLLRSFVAEEWLSSGPVHRPRGRVSHWSLTSPSSGRASEGRARAARPAGIRGLLYWLKKQASRKPSTLPFERSVLPTPHAFSWGLCREVESLCAGRRTGDGSRAGVAGNRRRRG